MLRLRQTNTEGGEAMSVKYICDVCGKEVPRVDLLHPESVDGYENRVAVGYAWKGDVCGECLTEIEYAADMAKMDAIEKLKAVKR